MSKNIEKDQANEAEPDKKTDKDVINRGSVVQSAQGAFEICQLLGSGGYGDVYMVRNVKENTVAAMKIERQDVESSRQRLALEVLILTGVAQLPEWRRAHFARLLSYGQNYEFKFVIMSMVGRTISEIQRQQPDSNYTIDKAVKISIQCLEAISQLHHMGFIHRDVKPNNFALGIGRQYGAVVLFDFGCARRFVHKELSGVPRKPRPIVKLVGTLRYASRNALRLREQCRKDDLESLFYTILQVFNVQALFWWTEKDIEVILTLKQKLFIDELTLLRKFPPELTKFAHYIDKLSYYSTPDYSYLQTLLQNIAFARGLWLPCSSETVGKPDEILKVEKTQSKDLEEKQTQKSKKGNGKKSKSRKKSVDKVATTQNESTKKSKKEVAKGSKSRKKSVEKMAPTQNESTKKSKREGEKGSKSKNKTVEKLAKTQNEDEKGSKNKKKSAEKLAKTQNESTKRSKKDGEKASKSKKKSADGMAKTQNEDEKGSKNKKKSADVMAKTQNESTTKKSKKGKETEKKKDGAEKVNQKSKDLTV
ncbi:unnamed protein product [Bursaphelenchus xylophilus]|uniref:(pine wood nematode) hypothetical protein n=1 Tax=Bursaphelenchus xylophilus TaxID=6326 RepID=A0A1I7SRX7_BURXY|nr:unnamed protein product [Bursaphelenchus xylophilus]CAG9101738.1 unnamed protein product [Bursaphelenchus xylophilus]